MLGVGWTEMLVIGVVALIVIGPKELPALMQKLGRFAGTVRRMGADFQRELNKTTGLDEVRNLRNAITSPLKQTTDAIRKEFNTITPSGAVQPSGVLKPADPKAETVVDEIRNAAGMPSAPAPTPAEAMKAAVTKAAVVAPTIAAPTAPVPTEIAAPAKPRRVTKAKAAPGAETPAVNPAPKSKPVESPAPVEAIAPAKQPRRRAPTGPKFAAKKA